MPSRHPSIYSSFPILLNMQRNISSKFSTTTHLCPKMNWLDISCQSHCCLTSSSCSICDILRTHWEIFSSNVAQISTSEFRCQHFPQSCNAGTEAESVTVFHAWSYTELVNATFGCSPWTSCFHLKKKKRVSWLRNCKAWFGWIWKDKFSYLDTLFTDKRGSTAINKGIHCFIL